MREKRILIIQLLARDGLGRFCSRVKTSSVKNFVFYTININAAAENGYNLRPQGRERWKLSQAQQLEKYHGL